MSEASVQRESPWAASLRGARANLLPGFVLQLVALTLVVAYYHHAGTRALLERLSAFRLETGFLYGIVATAVFGALVPGLYLKLNPATRHRYSARYNVVLFLFWAYKGLEVDLWYRFLAHFIDEGNDVSTIATKLVVDQLIYCPLWAVPLTVVLYEWCDLQFNTGALLSEIRQPGWYLRRVLPMLIPNFAVWAPMVCIIYALPTPLQLPLFNLVLCFYTLLLAHITRGAKT